MTVQMEPIPSPDPGGPRHVMSPDQFWERFIDMCQTTDSRVTEVIGTLFGSLNSNEEEEVWDRIADGYSHPSGLIAHLVSRIETLESRLEALEERS